MKNFYTLVLLMVAAMGVSAQDTVSVIFAIDMNGVANVSTDGVSIAGTIQDNYAGTSCGEWNPGCTVLTDDDQDGVWTIKLRLPVGTYLYKYVNGNAWGNNEGGGLTDACGEDDGNGGLNRTLDLTNAPLDRDTVVGPFKYDSCAVSSVQVTSIDREFANELSMSVAPNPTSHGAVLSFSNEAGKRYTFTMTSMTGAIVRREVVSNSSVEIARRDLPAGLYFLTLTNGEGQQASQKLLLQ